MLQTRPGIETEHRRALPRVKRGFWRESTLARAAALRTEIEQAHGANRCGAPGGEALYEGIRRHLDTALDAAASRSGIGFVDWWMGSRMDRAFLNIHQAEILATEFLTDEQVEERAPNVLVHLKALEPTDERRVISEQRLAPVVPGGRESGSRRAAGHGTMTTGRRPTAEEARCRRIAFATALRWAYGYGDEQYARLRTFRNSLVISTVILLLVVATLVLVGHHDPGWVPLCFDASPPDEPGTESLTCPTLEIPQAGLTPAQVQALVPASGAAVVALFGLVGAILSASGTVRSMKSLRDALGIRLILVLFKLPFGSLVALVGLILIQGRFVPGLSALDDPGQIIAYAIALGASQHVVTRLIDRQTQSLLERTPSRETGAPAAADTTRSP